MTSMESIIQRFPAQTDRTKLAVLKEAVERADMLASSQAQTIEMQTELIAMQRARIRQLESEVAEYRASM
jgi:hypothetical protein